MSASGRWQDSESKSHVSEWHGQETESKGRVSEWRGQETESKVAWRSGAAGCRPSSREGCWF